MEPNRALNSPRPVHCQINAKFQQQLLSTRGKKSKVALRINKHYSPFISVNHGNNPQYQQTCDSVWQRFQPGFSKPLRKLKSENDSLFRVEENLNFTIDYKHVPCCKITSQWIVLNNIFHDQIKIFPHVHWLNLIPLLFKDMTVKGSPLFHWDFQLATGTANGLPTGWSFQNWFTKAVTTIEGSLEPT